MFRQELKWNWHVQEELAFQIVFFKSVAKEDLKIDGRNYDYEFNVIKW
jgi:hypothetical protein